MVRKVRVMLLTAALSMAAWSGAPVARGQGLPAAPVPVNPSPDPPPSSTAPPTTQPSVAPLPLPPPPPGAYGPPPPVMPPLAPYQDRNGSLLRGDPLLDRPGYPPPGWYIDLGFAVLSPHVSNSLTGTVNVQNIFTDTVQLPTADLDWAVAPSFELGYRLAEGNGAISLGYHSVYTTGTATLPGFDLDGSDGWLRSRLEMDVIDLTYSSQEYSLGPQWDLQWLAGLRIGDVFFDSHAVGRFIEQYEDNRFVGAGPRLGFDIWRKISDTNLALYGHVDGSALLGEVKQRYSESLTFPGLTLSGFSVQSQDQAVPVLDAQIGLSWTPPTRCHFLRFTAGYEFQQWWYVGKVGASQANILLQGVFLRGQWSF